jgi:hypothetical protein
MWTAGVLINPKSISDNEEVLDYKYVITSISAKTAPFVLWESIAHNRRVKLS